VVIAPNLAVTNKEQTKQKKAYLNGLQVLSCQLQQSKQSIGCQVFARRLWSGIPSPLAILKCKTFNVEIWKRFRSAVRTSLHF
jgi:hypothetical protein